MVYDRSRLAAPRGTRGGLQPSSRPRDSLSAGLAHSRPDRGRGAPRRDVTDAAFLAMPRLVAPGRYSRQSCSRASACGQETPGRAGGGCRCGALGSSAVGDYSAPGAGAVRIDRYYVEASNSAAVAVRRIVMSPAHAQVAARRAPHRVTPTSMWRHRRRSRRYNARHLRRRAHARPRRHDNFGRASWCPTSASRRLDWVYGACVGAYGLPSPSAPRLPCCAAVLEEMPPPGSSPTCATAGVIAPSCPRRGIHARKGKLLGRYDALLRGIVTRPLAALQVEALREAPWCPSCTKARTSPRTRAAPTRPVLPRPVQIPRAPGAGFRPWRAAGRCPDRRRHPKRSSCPLRRRRAEIVCSAKAGDRKNCTTSLTTRSLYAR